MIRAMKPETLERRSRERVDARKMSDAELLRRLREKADAAPGSIWGELLAEQIERVKREGGAA